MRLARALLFVAAPVLAGTPVTCPEACDASAVAALDDRHFVAASDEDNVLRVYDKTAPGRVVARTDVSRFLGITDDEEADLEGVARLTDLLIWTTSHARSKKGEVIEARRRLFATRGATAQEPAGSPYRDLIADMAAAPELKSIPIAQAALLPPEKPGSLNIEGIAVDAKQRLLIGLRSPMVDGRAVIIPMKNPRQVLLDRAKPVFDPPVLVPLGGQGIRAMENAADRILLVSGDTADGGTFRVFSWSGAPDAEPVEVLSRPWAIEGLAAWKDGAVTLAADDGDMPVGSKPCKKAPIERRAFRLEEITLP
jgi:hypothetical protein